MKQTGLPQAVAVTQAGMQSKDFPINPRHRRKPTNQAPLEEIKAVTCQKVLFLFTSEQI